MEKEVIDLKYNENISLLLKKDILSKQGTASYKIKPLITYNNSLLNKLNVLKENKDKSGIYRWVNKINSENYVGRSINLSSRFRSYYSKKFLINKILTGNSRICRALLFYNYYNFDLEILEYCDKKLIVEREQYYIDLLKPRYNILLNSKANYNSRFIKKLQGP